MDEHELAAIGAQLAGRMREDTVEANAQWLLEQLPDPADWFRLNFALAAAVPVEVPWSVLTEWAGRRGLGAAPAVAEIGLSPHGTRAAVTRHQKRKEPLCELCRASERERKRAGRAVHRLGKTTVDKGVDNQVVGRDGPEQSGFDVADLEDPATPGRGPSRTVAA